MNDSAKTREELIGELQALREQIARLQPSTPAEPARSGGTVASPIRARPEDNYPPGKNVGVPRRNGDALREVLVRTTSNRGSAAPAAAVRQKKELLQGIVANAPAILWALDRDGVFLLSEGKTLEVLGLKPGEVVGRSVYDVYRDVPEIGENTRRALAGESISTVTDVNGVVFANWHSPLRSTSGEIMGVVGLALDVTKQKEAEEQLLTQQRLMEEMLRSHERDRRLTAYEIHDGLVQDATGAGMHLDALLRKETVAAGHDRDELELASDLVRKAINEARRLISGLRPPILDELGVAAAIEHLVREQPVDGPSIECKVQVQFDRLEPLLEGTIYRIVQEAMTNVRRHSKSDRAEIRLTQAADRIRLEIQDWGVGFDPARIEGKHFGLQGIRERARLLRGRAFIESTPGKGSRVFVDLPVAGVPKEVGFTNERSIE